LSFCTTTERPIATEPGRETGALGPREVLEGLLHHIGVALAQPFVLPPGLGQLAALLGETGRRLLAPAPVGVLLDGQVPHIPGVRAVAEHDARLLTRRIHPET
jgi:hypothetical protein